MHSYKYMICTVYVSCLLQNIGDIKNNRVHSQITRKHLVYFHVHFYKTSGTVFGVYSMCEKFSGPR